MTKEELETREKSKLRNIAIEWLRTEHSEGNIQSLVNLISSFTEPREKRIEELEAQIEKMKSALIDIKYNTDDVNIEWQIKYLFDELEIKENEELKEVINNDVDKKIYVQLVKKTELADVQKEQLTKAKEIIKTLSDIVSKSDSEDYFKRDMVKAVEQAEQFLKE